MIIESAYSPDFVHGLADDTAGEVSPYDIPALLDMLLLEEASNDLVSERIGIDISLETPESNNVFTVSDEGHDKICIASSYYNISPVNLIRLAISIRHDILTHQSSTCLYSFTTDGYMWEDLKLHTAREEQSN